MLQFFSLDVYCLLDPGYTLSYVTPFVSVCIGSDPKVNLDHFSISTMVGNSVITKRVYIGCGICWW